MSKNSDDSEKVGWWTNGWEIFGKFMAIVTCTGAIVTIYINLSPSGPDLVGYGWHTTLYYPPQFEAARDIRNEGDRVASDIVLDIPRRGIALINHPDTVQYVTPVDRNVSLNNLRPGNKIEVNIWTVFFLFRVTEDRFRITYDSGVGSIAFSKEFLGFGRSVVD